MNERHPPRGNAMPAGVDWLPVDEALAALRAMITPLDGAEDVITAQALGRVMARPAVAVRSNPPCANSAVDGYGFTVTGDTPLRLPLVEGRAAAGVPFAGTVPAGRAVRILTGARIPEGVTAVAMQEDCTVEGDDLVMARVQSPGANIRPAGEDMAQGESALAPGRRLTPADLALATALGVAHLAVRPKLRVGVLSTGDEILPDPGHPAAAHQIWDANRPMLLAMIASWGWTAVDLGHARDDAEAVRAALDRGAAEVDLMLTSGGASTGDEDHVARILSQEGQHTAWRIAMKPGRPLALSDWRGVPVLGLPGNPVAAFVCAQIFGKPAMTKRAGADWPVPLMMQVPAAFKKRKKGGRREWLRAKLVDGRAEIYPSEGSGLVRSISWADGLVELPDEACDISPGDLVRYLPINV